MTISPHHYGLNARTKLEQIDTKHIGIVKLVKSRIIRKDALKVIEMVDKIQTTDSELKVSLICTDNICSKSIKLLAEQDIEVIYQK
ncbi:hypothetical protein [Carboxylicivirga sp. N1Y90]|uniref:hypothetical protein n=1 Tax=Carboxylicivirga fragile TaxID=3417571 RepID=UPI003D32C815|nr:hypothetical protein [Marinilabiliaceae bacterium N1Y90]